MATTLNDKSQILLPGEIYGSNDIVSLGRQRRKHSAGKSRRLSSQGIRQPDLVAKEVRVLQLLKEMRAGGTRWGFKARCEWRPHLNEPSSDFAAEFVPARFGWPSWVTGPDARDMERGAPRVRVGPSTLEQIVGKEPSAAAAVFKKRLLFILWPPFCRRSIQGDHCSNEGPSTCYARNGFCD
jgi:hypothetical protein